MILCARDWVPEGQLGNLWRSIRLAGLVYSAFRKPRCLSQKVVICGDVPFVELDTH